MGISKAEHLAREALTSKGQIDERIQFAVDQVENQGAVVRKFQDDINKLKASVDKYKVDPVRLKAHAASASATERINCQVSGIGVWSTSAIFDRMREKIEVKEAHNEIIGVIGTKARTVDEEVEAALAPDVEADIALNALKTDSE